MFGLGTWEIVLILVVALVFIGPDKLPQVARSIGKGMRQVRTAMSQVDHEVRQAADDFVNKAMKDGEDEAPPPKLKPMPKPEREPEPEEAEHPVLVAPPAVAEPPAPRAAEGAASEAGSARPVRAPGPPATTTRDWQAHLAQPVAGRVAAVRPGRRPSSVVEIEDDPGLTGGPSGATAAPGIAATAAPPSARGVVAIEDDPDARGVVAIEDDPNAARGTAARPRDEAVTTDDVNDAATAPAATVANRTGGAEDHKPS